MAGAAGSVCGFSPLHSLCSLGITIRAADGGGCAWPRNVENDMRASAGLLHPSPMRMNMTSSRGERRYHGRKHSYQSVAEEKGSC